MAQWVVEVCGCVSGSENCPLGRGGVSEPESGPVGYCGPLTALLQITVHPGHTWHPNTDTKTSGAHQDQGTR